MANSSDVKNVVYALAGITAATLALLFFTVFVISIGVVALLFAISFAIVGRGNRLLWLMISPLIFALLIVTPYSIFAYLDSRGNAGGILIALLGFALIPILPSVFLGIAHTIRLLRSKHSNN